MRLKNKKELGLKTKFNFIYVGQLIERKGLYDLLESYKDLMEMGFSRESIEICRKKSENKEGAGN